MSKISKKWREMARVYKLFMREVINEEGETQIHPGLDWSEEAAMEAYKHESTGGKSGGIFDDTKNGYIVSKKIMDVTVGMWKESIAEGTLFPFELFGEFPRWFLVKVGVVRGNEGFYEEGGEGYGKTLGGMI